MKTLVTILAFLGIASSAFSQAVPILNPTNGAIQAPTAHKIWTNNFSIKAWGDLTNALVASNNITITVDPDNRKIMLASPSWQAAHATLTLLSALTGGNPSNFFRGDGTFQQISTNNIPGLVQALADGVAGGGGGGSGSIGGLVIGSDTNIVTNAVASAYATFVRSNGTFYIVLTDVPATLLSGTIDVLRIPSSILRSNDAAATYATINNPTFTGTLTISDATIAAVTVTSNLVIPLDNYGSSWSSKAEAASKKDVYDKIEAFGSLPFVSGITGGSRMVVDDLFSVSATAGDDGTTGINLGGSVIATTSVGQGGRHGVRVVRVANTNSAPVFGWHEYRTFLIPSQGSSSALFFGAEFKTPDKPSGHALTNVYSLQAAFHTSYTADTNRPTDFVGFIHQTNLFSTVNWFFGSVSNNAGVNWVDTGVAYTNSAWYKLGVTVDGTNSFGYVNNVLVATNSTAIPFGRAVGASVRNAVYSGTTTLDIVLDKLANQYR